MKPRHFKTAKSTGPAPRVLRQGGYSGAGIIRGVSVVTRGEALGHGLWLDEKFLHQVSDAINESPRGTKARFTHPNMSGDALGTFLGRAFNAKVVGDQVIADLHLSKAAERSPDGNLADYVLTMAETEPQNFGLSIVFTEDLEAMEAHAADLEQGLAAFDPDNVDAFPHARLGRLFAVDAVDEPAANPDGLFHRGNPVFEDAERLASFALGLSEETPEPRALSLDPHRVRAFVARFLHTHKLRVVNMAGENDELFEDLDALIEEMQADIDADDEDDDEAVEADTEAVATEPEAPAAVPAPTPEPVAARTGRDFLERFGNKGAVWYALGKTWAEAYDLYVAELEAENAELQKRLEVAAKFAGENAPVSFTLPASENKQKRQGLEGKIRIAGRNY